MKKQLLYTLLLCFGFYFSYSQFNESFEGTTGPDALPSTNWTLGSGNWYVFQNGVGLGERWKINNNVATPPLVHSGSNAAYINREEMGIGNTSEDYLATPMISFVPNQVLRFYSRNFTNGNQGTIYQIKVCSATVSPTDPSNYVTIAEFTEDQISSTFNIYAEKIVELPPYLIGTAGHIAFVRKYTQPGEVISGDRWLIDDVSIFENTPCLIAPNLLAVTANIYSINAFWIENGYASQWEVLTLPCGSPAPLATETGIITNTNPLTITGLNPETCYTVYVRSVCSPTLVSPWSNPFIVTTEIPLPTCGGIFTDSGGITSNYTNNSNQTYTICPTNPGDVVSITFSSFNIESTNDALYIFDGNSTAGTQVVSANSAGNVPGGLAGGYWGNSSPGTFTATTPNGCLTFMFRSNETVTNPGWVANINCGPLTDDSVHLISFIDTNNDGIQNSGETAFTEGSFVYQLNDSDVNNYIASSNGYANLFDNNPSNSYDFSYLINTELTPYLSNATNYSNISITPGNGIQTLYFPITVTNPYNDVSVAIYASNQPRPGFSYINTIVYKNIGLTTTSGTITFVKDPEVTITSISQSGITINSTSFSYDYTNLLPNEIRYIYVTMSVPTIPTVNISDILTNNVTITSALTDVYLTNNSFTNSQIVIGSYDPNDKMESHGGEIQFNQFAANDYLYYTIRFQNEGTADALTVRIEDLLDEQLDETSIRMVSASHPCTMQRNNNQITWTYDNINLAPTIVNEELSKGYVLFKIQLKPGYAIGDIIPNTANIFFDYNPAIVTNTFNTEFVAALNNFDFNSGNFLIYPNPSNDFVQISLKNVSEKIKNITIFTILGKEIKKTEAVNSNQTNLNISDLSSGIYMIEVTTENDLKQVEKLLIK